MKRSVNILIVIGAIIILAAALFKEMHWQGKKELMLLGIFVLLAAMLLYLGILIKNKQISN